MKRSRDPLHDLREAARDHVLRNTVCPDADQQRAKQAEAARKHERDQAEREAHLASLQTEAPNESVATVPGRLKPIPISKQPRVGRVATARAQQQKQPTLKGKNI
jgi:hypothetical protein